MMDAQTSLIKLLIIKSTALMNVAEKQLIEKLEKSIMLKKKDYLVKKDHVKLAVAVIY